MRHNLEVTHNKQELKRDDVVTAIRIAFNLSENAKINLRDNPILMLREEHNDDIYRVNVSPPTHIEVICFGIDKLDDTIEGVYDNINDLPNWMQERLSVLSMLPPNTSGGNDVEGIGRRITESIYWVYAQK
jgi:hypothetical protein